MMIHTDTTKTAAFTGHRFIRYNDRQQLRTELERAITICYDSGIRHFLCGMALSSHSVGNPTGSIPRTKNGIASFSARLIKWFA